MAALLVPSQTQVRHGTVAGIARELGILRQHATGVAGLRLLPLGETGFEFGGGDAERDGAPVAQLRVE